MTLNDLILGIGDLRLQSGEGAVDVRDLALDSRRLKAGALFAALPGSKVDGRDFVPAAVKAGTVAILAPDGSRFAYGRMDAVAAVAANPFPPSARQQASTRHLRGEHDTRWTR